MKISFGILWLYLLLILITAGYCLGVELAAMSVEDISKTHFESTKVQMPGPTLLFTHPDTKSKWQILGLVSFLGNMTWGIIRSRKSDRPDPHIFPAMNHICWILLCTSLHMLGLYLPIYKIGNFLA